MNEQTRTNGDAIINELPRMNVANLIQDIAFATQMLDINRIRAIDSSITKDVHHSDRQVVLDSARKLVSALESPEETICKISKEVSHLQLLNGFAGMLVSILESTITFL